MKNFRHLPLALATSAALLFAPLATRAAEVVFEGVLVSGIASTGSAGGFAWFLDDGALMDYWRFQANAGDTATLRVDRLNGNFDPALSLYQGQASGDTSFFSSTGNWGGTSYLGSLDDENPPFATPAGPNGDPFGSFTLPAAGWYTLAVGGATSTDGGVYNYRVTLTITPVPEPWSAALFAAGLAGLALRLHRRG